MHLKERIEQVITEMFNQDRQFNEHLNELPQEFIEWIDYSTWSDYAMDLIGIPKDNTLLFDLDNDEINESNIKSAEEERKCVYFCRDYLTDRWFTADNADLFISECRRTRKDYVEEMVNRGFWGKVENND